jgi:hypothetical protein
MGKDAAEAWAQDAAEEAAAEPRMFELSIRLGNDAMRHPDDVAGALEEAALKLRATGGSVDPEAGRWGATISDVNGNRVGEWSYPPPLDEGGDEC